MIVVKLEVLYMNMIIFAMKIVQVVHIIIILNALEKSLLDIIVMNFKQLKNAMIIVEVAMKVGQMKIIIA